MLPVVRTDLAERDLADILTYWTENSPSAAQKLYDSLEKRFQLLSEVPGLGHPRDDLLPGVRSTVVDKHVIFYRPTDDAVQILRVLHGARDIAAQFRDMESDQEESK